MLQWSWIGDLKERAVASKLWNMSAGGVSKTGDLPTCPKCKNKHKPGARFCTKKDDTRTDPPVVHGHLTIGKITTRDQLNEYISRKLTTKYVIVMILMNIVIVIN